MQEIQFDYFRGMEAEQYSFYRVPKVLFTAECFKSLSCEAKVLYGLMLDRMSLSIKNRWFDEEDRVYIIFTVEEIAELLNCGSQKAVKLMKELDSNQGIGLIEKKRLGLGKPNVIYVKNFMLKEKHSFEKEEKAAVNAENMQNSENHNLRIVKTTNQEFPESQFKNDENHNSGIVKITNQEFPESQFKDGENHNSRIVKIITQEVPKSQSNNTDINKTDYSETDPIQSYQFCSAGEECLVSGDMMEKMEVYREILRTNVDYAGFVQKGEREDVDELIELVVEILMLPDDSMVRIGGADKPVAVVKSRFLKLTYSHIEYVLFSLHRNTSKVANIKAYLLTTLYNSSMTMNQLAPFDIAELRELTSYDELELDKLGDRKTAMFVIISDTDDTFNFIVAIMYTQLFNLLCDKADDVYGGRLPYHVTEGRVSESSGKAIKIPVRHRS